MPTTWFLALAGGAMIGGAAALLLVTHGRIAGISGILGSLLPPTPAPDRDSAVADSSGDVATALADAAVDALNLADVADAKVDVDPCSDRDDDGVIAVACDGGTDCDDDDNRARPDAGFLTDPPTAVTKGDWNCDGMASFQRPINVKCADHNSSLSNCALFYGFKGDPGCGGTGDFVTCKNPTLSGPCIEGVVAPTKQGCK